jgi:hypothetical protein
MNERSGLCGPKDGSYLPEWFTGVGAGKFRFSGDLDHGMSREVAQVYVDHGLELVLTYDSDTFRNRTDDEAVAGLAERYGGLIGVVEVGNEPDGAGSESSRMPHERINRLMEISRYRWGDNQLLCGPGLISGDESWLDGFDFTHCNLVGLHPYGQWAPGAYRGEGPYFGTLDQIMMRYVDKARALSGRFIPLFITEDGMSTFQVSYATQAHYIGTTVRYFLERTDILAGHTIFAFHDFDGFGLLDPAGNWKPSLDAYIAAVNYQTLRASMQKAALQRVDAWQGVAHA